MMENNEFDDLIRSKMEGNNFPFEEADWFQAEQLIEKQRKKEKRRKFFFIWFFGLLSGVLLTVGVLFSYNSIKGVGNNNVVSNQSSTKEISGLKLSGNTNLENTKTDDNSVQSHGILNNSSIKSEATETSNVKSLMNNVNTSSNITKSGIQQPKKINVKGSSSNPINNETNIKIVNYKEPEKKVVESKAEELKNSATNDSTTNKHVETSNLSKDSVVNEGLTVQTKDTTVNKVNDDSLLVNESSKQVKKEINEDKQISKFNIFLTAGSIYQLGWQSNKNIEGKGLGFVSGLGLENKLNKKVSISSGMFVYSGGRLNNYYDSVNYARPDFGKKDSVLKCNYKRIFFAEIPLTVNYYLNNKNKITAGINTSIASFSSCNFQTIVITDPGMAIINEEKRYNYFRGVRKINIGAQIGYGYSLSDKWLIQLMFHYGFTDSMDDKVFRYGSVVERNTNIRLNVNYKIFSK